MQRIGHREFAHEQACYRKAVYALHLYLSTQLRLYHALFFGEPGHSWAGGFRSRLVVEPASPLTLSGYMR